MQVLEAGLSDPMRRVWLKRGAGVAALPLMGGAAALLAACGSTDPAPSNPTRPSALGFGAVAESVTDTLVVASGYTANVLFRLGDPISPWLICRWLKSTTSSTTSFAAPDVIAPKPRSPEACPPYLNRAMPTARKLRADGVVQTFSVGRS